MPGYAGTAEAKLLYENRQQFLLQQEQVTGPSIAVQLERQRSACLSGASFQIYFTDANGNPADPGIFQIDIQDSDIDEDSQYCTVVAYTSGQLNANFAGRVGLSVVLGKYIRVFVVAVTNPVYTTVQITDFPGSGGGIGVVQSTNQLPDAPSDGITYGRENANWVPVVNLAGDVMTGPLVLANDPTAPLQAATKEYVDNYVNEVTATLSGILTFAGSIDGPTGTCQFFGPLAGDPPGPLPAAAPANNNYYFICTASGTPPSGPIAGDALNEGNWVLSDGVAWTVLPFSTEVVAGNVVVSPTVAGASNVQTALTNINSNQALYLPLAGGTVTGNVTINPGTLNVPNGVIVGNGGINTGGGMGVSGGGLSFGSRTGTSPQDTSQQITLWGSTTTGMGFGITNGQLNHNVPGSNAHVFYVGGSEIARVNSAGILFGSTNQSQLQWVNNTSASSGPNPVIQAYDGASRRLWALQATQSGAIVGGNPEGTIQIFTMNGGFGWQRLMTSTINSPPQTTWNGQLNAPAFNVTSDHRLKKNIREAEEHEHRSAFAALKPVRFQWAFDGDEQWNRPKWGFVADEVEKGSADIVHTHSESGMKGYDAVQVLALAVAEIHRLGKQVEILSSPWYRRLGRAVTNGHTNGHIAATVNGHVSKLVNALRLAFTRRKHAGI